MLGAIPGLPFGLSSRRYCFRGTSSTHFTSQVNGQGLRGIGETSGLSYVWKFASGSNSTIDDPYPLVVSVPFNSHVIAEGTEPDFRHHFLAHLTINENGEVTSDVFESRTECE
jgi:hypothetical protein